MSENVEQELAKEYKAHHEKFCYFLLAAAASAIGFSITQLKVEPLQCIHIFLFFSIFLWATSFISGVQALEHTKNLILFSCENLAIQRNILGMCRNDKAQSARLIQSTETEFYEKMNKKENELKRDQRLQKWSLLLGGLAYIAWYVAQMWALNVKHGV